MTAARNAAKADAVLAGRVSIPQTVVYRSFAQETVVLNLDTGLYHGLNPTAGRMLDALSRVGSARQAAELIASEYQRPLTEVQDDLCSLCEGLLERGLIVIEPG